MFRLLNETKRSRNLNKVILADGYFRVMNYKNPYLAPPPFVDYIIQENYFAETVIVIPVNFCYCETPRFINVYKKLDRHRPL